MRLMRLEPMQLCRYVDTVGQDLISWSVAGNLSEPVILQQLLLMSRSACGSPQLAVQAINEEVKQGGAEGAALPQPHGGLRQ